MTAPLDLSRLSPAPWRAVREPPGCSVVAYVQSNGDETASILDGSFEDAEFIALARNAFEVMVRRGWHVRRATTGEWVVYTQKENGTAGLANTTYLTTPDGRLVWSTDPFTALVEADEWYRETIEKGPNP